jgi:DNA-binding NarL/FixJ family response regulator
MTSRELDVAALVADGLTNREIAEKLGVTVSTIEKHLSNLSAKLNLHNRVLVARWYWQNQGLPQLCVASN